MGFFESIAFFKEKPKPKASREELEDRLLLLEDLKGRRADLLRWLKAGEGTPDDRRIMEDLNKEIEALSEVIKDKSEADGGS